MTTSVRPELGELPSRLARLPIDDRGYPVPWFVDWIDGKPEFRAMDLQKFAIAVRERRCWVCGGYLGKYYAFVTGPMCVINGTSAEPPCHLDCAQWSARFCPFLSRPRMRRRSDEDFPSDVSRSAAGAGILRNPGAAAVLVTTTYRVFRSGIGPRGEGRDLPLIEMGPPIRVEWYAEGRMATRAEVLASVESGIPLLEAAIADERAEDQPAARTELERRRRELNALLPEA